MNPESPVDAASPVSPASPVSGDDSPSGIRVTGVAQRAAWRAKELPPVELVRDALWSVPVPIPHNPLRYTLCYAYVDDTGVVLVDPGWDSPTGREALTAGLAVAGAAPTDVTGVLITHIHPDHHGLSGWLRRHGAWIAMHPLEADSLPAKLWRHRRDRDWLAGHGVPEPDLEGLVFDLDRIPQALELAEPDRLIDDGDVIKLAGRELRAIWTPGHTPGHLCLHDPAVGALLTGDHLLPRISPNIGVHDDGPGDPLGSYLESLGRMGRFPDEEALPAHEYRFRGVEARALALVAHHRQRDDEVLRAIAERGEETGWEIAAALTWSRGWPSLHGMMRRMALGETVAHLRHLAHEGRVVELPGPPRRWRLRAG